MNQLIFFVLTFWLGGSVLLYSQAPISGQVIDYEGNSIKGVEVLVYPEEITAISTRSGEFSFDRLDAGQHTIVTRKNGYQTYTKQFFIGSFSINDLIIQMDDDPLELSGRIQTGSFRPESKLRSASSLSSMAAEEIQQKAAYGTTALLQNIPGILVDNSAGEAFGAVYSRGLSASIQPDLGWYYAGLQEDGLPITLINHRGFSPDLFHRTDISTKRLEALRGGIASITGTNSPGGVFNFISKTGEDSPGIELNSSTNLQAGNNFQHRFDANIGGRSKDKSWIYNIGGFYRSDNGIKDTDFLWSEGGQAKFSISKINRNGHIRVHVKYLNDLINRLAGLPAINWAEPEAAFGLDFNTNHLSLPSINAFLPNGRASSEQPVNFNPFDPTSGILLKDFSTGLDLTQHLGNGWTLENKFKLSNKSTDWQTIMTNHPLFLNNPDAYAFSGSDSPFGGNVLFRDITTNQIIARINNLGATNAFFGLPTTFNYLEGNLPNDALFGVMPFVRNDQVNEWMNQFSVSKEFRNHRLVFGGFLGSANLDTYTQASHAFATYEANPRLLAVSIEEPNTPVSFLSDENGFSNYGGLHYKAGEVKHSQIALFVRERWTIQEILTIDASLRYDRIQHQGGRDRFERSEVRGGLDNDPSTTYDNGFLFNTGIDNFNYTYDFTSYSIGTNYLIDNQISLFARLSNGHQAPGLNYYFDEFTDGRSITIPIDQQGIVQGIFQVEGGIKINRRKFSMLATAFWSQLNNIPYTELISNPNTGESFLTPLQLNTNNTFGLEIEGVYAPSGALNFRFAATFQNAEATKFTIFNPGEDITDDADDFMSDFSGKTLPHNPGIITEISPEYHHDNWTLFMTWRFIGERKANIANAFSLPGFSTFHFGTAYTFGSQIDLRLTVNNVFNTKGFLNFYGPNTFGNDINDVTFDFVEKNLDASFLVAPIIPRIAQLSVGYKF